MGQAHSSYSYGNTVVANVTSAETTASIKAKLGILETETVATIDDIPAIVDTELLTTITDGGSF